MPSLVEIKDFVNRNLGNPLAIRDAMNRYNVNDQQIGEATGYTQDQIAEYWRQSMLGRAGAPTPQWTSGPGGGNPYPPNPPPWTKPGWKSDALDSGSVPFGTGYNPPVAVGAISGPVQGSWSQPGFNSGGVRTDAMTWPLNPTLYNPPVASGSEGHTPGMSMGFNPSLNPPVASGSEGHTPGMSMGFNPSLSPAPVPAQGFGQQNRKPTYSWPSFGNSPGL